MTSKRSSRVFSQDESERSDYHQHPSSSTASYRPRTSRSVSTEDLRSSTSEEGDSKCNTLMEKKDKAVVMRCPPGPVAVEDMALSAVGEAIVAPMPEAFTSYPPAPLEDRPHNFGVVVPGFYRSSYPKPDDYNYLQSLHLKTILTLVKDDDVDHELGEFVAREGIKHVVIHMKGTKKEAIPEQTMTTIIHVLQDKRHWPILLHCNHGKHRTGCVVAVMRKISGWSNRDVINEYTSYAAPKIRECDIEYITSFQTSPFVRGLPMAKRSRFTPVQTRNFRRALMFSMFVLCLWLMSGTSLASTRSQLLR